jgi:hypothetical protein
VRRKRASNEIAALDQGVDPNELPSAPKVDGTAKEPKKEPGLQGGIVRNDPFTTEPKPGTKPKSPGTTPKPKPSATSESGANLDDATSGDRAKMTGVKNALKAKVAGGKASDQEKRTLRGLCRQLGDMSCAN